MRVWADSEAQSQKAPQYQWDSGLGDSPHFGLLSSAGRATANRASFLQGPRPQAGHGSLGPQAGPEHLPEDSRQQTQSESERESLGFSE